MQITLDEDDFKILVSGGTVKKSIVVHRSSSGWGQSGHSSQKQEVQIDLEQIGHHKMIQAMSKLLRKE